jgi:tRNA-dihydrouridine synthase
MEDVSDPPFRAVCKQNGADLMYTEFISSEGLIRDAAKSVQKLDVYDYERPVGIQIFGAEIESMREAAAIAEAADQTFWTSITDVLCTKSPARVPVQASC